MVEITIKYGETFKKGKEFHRIDLTIRTETSKEVDTVFKRLFNGLKREVKELKEDILKDARI